MAKTTNETNAVAEYRAVLLKERDEQHAIVEDRERRLPELKRKHDVSKQAVDDHVRTTYAGGHDGQHPAQLERNQLLAVRQADQDAFTACERDIDRARPRLAELDRLLGADAAVAELTKMYAAALTAATAKEQDVTSSAEMIARIDEEKGGRAGRRDEITKTNMAASIKHAAITVAARKEGRPLPDAPKPVLLSASDASDADLDLQRNAAIQLNGQYGDELRGLVDDIVATRDRLIRARFDAVDFKAAAALSSIKFALIEYEGARQVGRYYGRELEIPLDDLAVRARVNAIELEVPVWVPMAKRDEASTEADDAGSGDVQAAVA